MSRNDRWIIVRDLQVRVRPIPHWSHDPSKNGGFLCQPVGGGNGIHLGGGRDGFETAQEAAQQLTDNPAGYAAIHEDLERSNRPIPQWYLDLCRGQEL